MVALIVGGLIAAGGILGYSLYKTFTTPKENTSISLYGWVAIILAIIFIIGLLYIMSRG